LIGFAYKPVAPLCRHHGKQDINRYGDGRDHRVSHRKGEGKDHRHHQNLKQRRHNVEHQKTHQEADAIGAALDVAADAASGTVEMKCQFQLMKMTKYPQANTAHGMSRDTTEQRIAKLAKEHAA